MKNWKPLIFSFLCILALASCGNSEDATTIYVLTPPQKASQFTEDLAIIAKRHGLMPNLGQATDDKGHTLRVVEAKANWVRLWAQNMPLSGNENPIVCGHYIEGHPDPGQYIVTIDHRVPLIARGAPRELIQDISKELKASGYDVRSTPALCSSLSKKESEP